MRKLMVVLLVLFGMTTPTFAEDPRTLFLLFSVRGQIYHGPDAPDGFSEEGLASLFEQEKVICLGVASKDDPKHSRYVVSSFGRDGSIRAWMVLDTEGTLEALPVLSQKDVYTAVGHMSSFAEFGITAQLPDSVRTGSTEHMFVFLRQARDALIALRETGTLQQSY